MVSIYVYPRKLRCDRNHLGDDAFPHRHALENVESPSGKTLYTLGIGFEMKFLHRTGRAKAVQNVIGS